MNSHDPLKLIVIFNSIPNAIYHKLIEEQYILILNQIMKDHDVSENEVNNE